MGAVAGVGGRQTRPDPAVQSGEGRTAMISTSHPLATEAGVAAFRAGGTAVDAYIAAGIVQTVVEPTMTSLAGVFSVSVFDPATGASRLAVGMPGLPAAEDGKLDDDARWSGRTVVAPGWISGAHAAWKTWGKLDWADLFTHALACARDGFTVDHLMFGWMYEYRMMAGRNATAREVWFPDGTMVTPGDVLVQPALARTIEQLAEHGPEYMYEGDFAKHLVDTAQAAGGRITLDDMASAQNDTMDIPLPVFHLANGYDLHTSGSLYVMSLNLAAAGKVGERARPTEDGETLYLQMRIVEESWHHGLSLAERGFGLEHVDQIVDEVSPPNAEKLWSEAADGPSKPIEPMNLNTNAIIAVDDSGMVAHGTHSTSSTPFGVGLMVDGVVLARPLYYFSDPVVQMPVGWATSLLALRDGKPVFAAGSPAISAYQNVFQNTMNVLDWGMTPYESVQQPRFGASVYPSRKPMVEATIGDELIADVERRGVGVTPVSPWEVEMGSCQSVLIDDDGALQGAADPRRLGSAEGF